jgi:oxygen-independent coproporphyrinogen-3 oxidase
LGLLRGWLIPDVRIVPLHTLYVGGGTPTVFGEELVTLIKGVAAVLPLADGAEVTVEANPESLTSGLTEALADAGVTRVSVGVQSLDDDALQRLDRRHDSVTALAALRSVVEAGLEPAADLMCGIPGVSAATWERSLEGVVEAGAVHVSVYPLTVEQGTPLAERIAAGVADAPDEDVVVDGMEAAARTLEALGFERYEVANYAMPGHRSRHNTAYWTGRPYIGVGGGAHGMLDAAHARACMLAPDDGRDVGRVRYSYAADPFPGDQPSPLASLELLTTLEAAREDAMLGMRMTDGIEDKVADRAGVSAVMRSLADDGLVNHDDGRWRPTTRGWLLGNEVFGRIWNAER